MDATTVTLVKTVTNSRGLTLHQALLWGLYRYTNSFNPFDNSKREG